ncbi:hypothetical protein QTP88_021765 [Uroleucon formosanum]
MACNYKINKMYLQFSMVNLICHLKVATYGPVGLSVMPAQAAGDRSAGLTYMATNEDALAVLGLLIAMKNNAIKKRKRRLWCKSSILWNFLE